MVPPSPRPAGPWRVALAGPPGVGGQVGPSESLSSHVSLSSELWTRRWPERQRGRRRGTQRPAERGRASTCGPSGPLTQPLERTRAGPAWHGAIRSRTHSDLVPWKAGASRVILLETQALLHLGPRDVVAVWRTNAGLRPRRRWGPATTARPASLCRTGTELAAGALLRRPSLREPFLRGGRGGGTRGATAQGSTCPVPHGKRPEVRPPPG